jgi:hypothetical protein
VDATDKPQEPWERLSSSGEVDWGYAFLLLHAHPHRLCDIYGAPFNARHDNGLLLNENETLGIEANAR